MKNPKAYIGTSGWNYKDWRKVFYPEGLKQEEWLAYLAKQFNTVEINNSFYRIPKAETIVAWQQKAGSNFRFSPKLWRGITHFKKLINCSEPLRNYFEVVEHFEPRHRGPLLVQLPANQGKAVEKLRRFLQDARRASSGRWKVTVEFRNPSWLCDEVYRVLDEERASLCLHDMKDQAPVSEPNDASFVYMRRHGPSQRHYEGSYSSEAIQTDGKSVRRWLKNGKMVFVYYNNDLGGNAAKNAQELAAAVGS